MVYLNNQTAFTLLLQEEEECHEMEQDTVSHDTRGVPLSFSSLSSSSMAVRKNIKRDPVRILPYQQAEGMALGEGWVQVSLLQDSSSPSSFSVSSVPAVDQKAATVGGTYRLSLSTPIRFTHLGEHVLLETTVLGTLASASEDQHDAPRLPLPTPLPTHSSLSLSLSFLPIHAASKSVLCVDNHTSFWLCITPEMPPLAPLERRFLPPDFILEQPFGVQPVDPLELHTTDINEENGKDEEVEGDLALHSHARPLNALSSKATISTKRFATTSDVLFTPAFRVDPVTLRPIPAASSSSSSFVEDTSHPYETEDKASRSGGTQQNNTKTRGGGGVPSTISFLSLFSGEVSSLCSSSPLSLSSALGASKRSHPYPPPRKGESDDVSAMGEVFHVGLTPSWSSPYAACTSTAAAASWLFGEVVEESRWHATQDDPPPPPPPPPRTKEGMKAMPNADRRPEVPPPACGGRPLLVLTIRPRVMCRNDLPYPVRVFLERQRAVGSSSASSSSPTRRAPPPPPPTSSAGSLAGSVGGGSAAATAWLSFLDATSTTTTTGAGGRRHQPLPSPTSSVRSSKEERRTCLSMPLASTTGSHTREEEIEEAPMAEDGLHVVDIPANGGIRMLPVQQLPLSSFLLHVEVQEGVTCYIPPPSSLSSLPSFLQSPFSVPIPRAKSTEDEKQEGKKIPTMDPSATEAPSIVDGFSFRSHTRMETGRLHTPSTSSMAVHTGKRVSVMAKRFCTAMGAPLPANGILRLGKLPKTRPAVLTTAPLRAHRIPTDESLKEEEEKEVAASPEENHEGEEEVMMIRVSSTTVGPHSSHLVAQTTATAEESRGKNKLPPHAVGMEWRITLGACCTLRNETHLPLCVREVPAGGGGGGQMVSLGGGPQEEEDVSIDGKHRGKPFSPPPPSSSGSNHMGISRREEERKGKGVVPSTTLLSSTTSSTRVRPNFTVLPPLMNTPMIAGPYGCFSQGRWTTGPGGGGGKERTLRTNFLTSTGRTLPSSMAATSTPLLLSKEAMEATGRHSPFMVELRVRYGSYVYATATPVALELFSEEGEGGLGTNSTRSEVVLYPLGWCAPYSASLPSLSHRQGSGPLRSAAASCSSSSTAVSSSSSSSMLLPPPSWFVPYSGSDWMSSPNEGYSRDGVVPPPPPPPAASLHFTLWRKPWTHGVYHGTVEVVLTPRWVVWNHTPDPLWLQPWSSPALGSSATASVLLNRTPSLMLPRTSGGGGTMKRSTSGSSASSTCSSSRSSSSGGGGNAQSPIRATLSTASFPPPLSQRTTTTLTTVRSGEKEEGCMRRATKKGLAAALHARPPRSQANAMKREHLEPPFTAPLDIEEEETDDEDDEAEAMMLRVPPGQCSVLYCLSQPLAPMSSFASFPSGGSSSSSSASSSSGASGSLAGVGNRGVAEDSTPSGYSFTLHGAQIHDGQRRKGAVVAFGKPMRMTRKKTLEEEGGVEEEEEEVMYPMVLVGDLNSPDEGEVPHTNATQTPTSRGAQETRNACVPSHSSSPSSFSSTCTDETMETNVEPSNRTRTTSRFSGVTNPRVVHVLVQHDGPRNRTPYTAIHIYPPPVSPFTSGVLLSRFPMVYLTNRSTTLWLTAYWMPPWSSLSLAGRRWMKQKEESKAMTTMATNLNKGEKEERSVTRHELGAVSGMGNEGKEKDPCTQVWLGEAAPGTRIPLWMDSSCSPFLLITIACKPSPSPVRAVEEIEMMEEKRKMREESTVASQETEKSKQEEEQLYPPTTTTMKKMKKEEAALQEAELVRAQVTRSWTQCATCQPTQIVVDVSRGFTMKEQDWLKGQTGLHLTHVIHSMHSSTSCAVAAGGDPSHRQLAKGGKSEGELTAMRGRGVEEIGTPISMKPAADHLQESSTRMRTELVFQWAIEVEEEEARCLRPTYALREPHAQQTWREEDDIETSVSVLSSPSLPPPPSAASPVLARAFSRVSSYVVTSPFPCVPWWGHAPFDTLPCRSSSFGSISWGMACRRVLPPFASSSSLSSLRQVRRGVREEDRVRLPVSSTTDPWCSGSGFPVLLPLPTPSSLSTLPLSVEDGVHAKTALSFTSPCTVEVHVSTLTISLVQPYRDIIFAALTHMDLHYQRQPWTRRRPRHPLPPPSPSISSSRGILQPYARGGRTRRTSPLSLPSVPTMESVSSPINATTEFTKGTILTKSPLRSLPSFPVKEANKDDDIEEEELAVVESVELRIHNFQVDNQTQASPTYPSCVLALRKEKKEMAVCASIKRIQPREGLHREWNNVRVQREAETTSRRNSSTPTATTTKNTKHGSSRRKFMYCNTPTLPHIYIRHFRVQLVPLLLRLSDGLVLRVMEFAKDMMYLWGVVGHSSGTETNTIISQWCRQRNGPCLSGHRGLPPPPPQWLSYARRALGHTTWWMEGRAQRPLPTPMTSQPSTSHIEPLRHRSVGGGRRRLQRGGTVGCLYFSGLSTSHDAFYVHSLSLAEMLERESRILSTTSPTWAPLCASCAGGGTVMTNEVLTEEEEVDLSPINAVTHVYVEEFVWNPIILRVWWCRDVEEDVMEEILGEEGWRASLVRRMRASFEDVRVTVPGLLTRHECRSWKEWGQWVGSFWKASLVRQVADIVLQYASSIPLLGAPVLLVRGLREGATRFFIGPIAVFDSSSSSSSPSSAELDSLSLFASLEASPREEWGEVHRTSREGDGDGAKDLTRRGKTGRLPPKKRTFTSTNNSNTSSPFFFTSLVENTLGFTSDVMSGGLGAVSNISKTGALLLDSATNVGGSVMTNDALGKPVAASTASSTHTTTTAAGGLNNRLSSSSMSTSSWMNGAMALSPTYSPRSMRGGTGWLPEMANPNGSPSGENGTALPGRRPLTRGTLPPSTSSSTPTPSSSISRGPTGFFSGIGHGLLGAFQRPIEGAIGDGVRGAIKGFAQGMVGVVAQPMSGLLTEVSMMTDTASQLLSDRFVPETPRLRPLRIFGVYGSPGLWRDVEETYEYQRGERPLAVVLANTTGAAIFSSTNTAGRGEEGKPMTQNDAVALIGNREWSARFLKMGKDGPEWYPRKREEVCMSTPVVTSTAPTNHRKGSSRKTIHHGNRSPPLSSTNSSSSSSSSITNTSNTMVVSQKIPYPLAGWKIDMGAGTIAGWLYADLYRHDQPRLFQPIVVPSHSRVRRRRWVLVKHGAGESMVVTDHAAEVVE